MIDFSKIEQYRENNRIEAKKALGGLPKSIWETYSAFANTHGGIILLGVEELADKSFRTVDLPDPEKLIKEFWDIVYCPPKICSSRRSMAIISWSSTSPVQNVPISRCMWTEIPSAPIAEMVRVTTAAPKKSTRPWCGMPP